MNISSSVIGRWLPLLGWMLIIFVASSRTATQLPSFGLADWLVKKGGHMAAYAIHLLLAQWAVRDWRLAFLITFLYACSDEYHQTFVPTRNGSPVDVGIDMAGAAVAWLAMRRRW